MSVAELRDAFFGRGELPDPAEVEALAHDRRPAYRALALALQPITPAELRRIAGLAQLEESLRDEGIRLVAGVDEAGAGCLAGPVVAAAVILPARWRCSGVDDSKRLSASARTELAGAIRASAIAVATASVGPREIDATDILRARLTAMRKAVGALKRRPEHVLVDGHLPVPELSVAQTLVVSGDARCLCVAAASIVAKVERDALMQRLDAAHPGYGFATHKGYPTDEHRRALARLGPSPIHRLTFAPVRAAQARLSPSRR